MRRLRCLATYALIFAATYTVTWLVLEALSERWTGHPKRACRMCYCTDARPCLGGCYWVSPDLCSACLFGLEGEGG